MQKLIYMQYSIKIWKIWDTVYLFYLSFFSLSVCLFFFLFSNSFEFLKEICKWILCWFQIELIWSFLTSVLFQWKIILLRFKYTQLEFFYFFGLRIAVPKTGSKVSTAEMVETTCRISKMVLKQMTPRFIWESVDI